MPEHTLQINSSTLIGVMQSKEAAVTWPRSRWESGRDRSLPICSALADSTNAIRHLWLQFCHSHSLRCARANSSSLTATWLIIGVCGSCARRYTWCLNTHSEPRKQPEVFFVLFFFYLLLWHFDSILWGSAKYAAVAYWGAQQVAMRNILMELKCKRSSSVAPWRLQFSFSHRFPP